MIWRINEDTFKVTNVMDGLATNSSSLNVTHASIAETFPQLAENIGSITNSIVFIIVYSIMLMFILAFYIKSRRQMKRNQKILFLMVGLSIIVQYSGLCWRLVYNGTALHLNISYSDYTQVTNLNNYRIALYVSAAFENALVLSQVIFIIIVTCFIQNMFLRTVENAGAMSRKVFKILKYLINIASIIFAVIMTPLILLNSAINLATKMQVLKFDLTPVVVIIIISFVVVVFADLFIFITLGIRLLMVVKKNSLKISQMKQNEQSSLREILQRPYSKIVGLILGILLTSLLQFIAGIVSFLTSTYAPYLHILDYFLQAFGILVFAVLVLLVYNPLVLSYNNPSVTNPNDEPNSQISSARQPASRRKSEKNFELGHLQQQGVHLQEKEIPEPNSHSQV